MNDLRLFFWIYLRDPIEWKTVLLSCDTFKNSIDEKLNKDLLFIEISHLKIFLNK
jgi:hypothetical protein